MAKLQLTAVLLLAVAAFAAPNARPAQRLPAASSLTPTTAAAKSAPTDEAQVFQIDLKAREPQGESQLSSATSSGNLVASSSNITMPGPLQTVSAPAGVATGMFTAADGGVYDVTSQSGYVVIDYKTLYPGQHALIGNEQVSLGSSGLVAAEQTVALSSMSSSGVAAASTTGSSAPPPSSSGSPAPTVSTFVSTSTRSMSAASTISTDVTLTSGTATASAAAARQTGAHMMAAAGGLLGLMIL